ncbi:DUF2397 family protein, partial [Kitasatospora nipponensis]|uniref:DUF2397 family protein n=1 Tax=Kitasatospora nipponensis TaxID=258049 RepID=UPI0031D93749
MNGGGALESTDLPTGVGPAGVAAAADRGPLDRVGALVTLLGSDRGPAPSADHRAEHRTEHRSEQHAGLATAPGPGVTLTRRPAAATVPHGRAESPLRGTGPAEGRGAERVAESAGAPTGGPLTDGPTVDGPTVGGPLTGGPSAGGSNAALLRLARRLARSGECAAHELFADAFGLFGARHFGVAPGQDTADRAEVSWWHGPTVRQPLVAALALARPRATRTRRRAGGPGAGPAGGAEPSPAPE